tara:strand:+ start:179 stop:880 length:702 start_codon:yes stop_codon:yes gene_type:complete
MIKLPKFTLQSMYDSETNFSLQAPDDRLAKLLIQYEAFKLIKNLKGSIVECGIFKGTSFVRLATFRNLFRKKNSTLIGFDHFGDNYPKTPHSNEMKIRKHFIKKAGSSSISTKQIRKIFKNKNIDNYKLVKGNVLKTVPEYVQNNKNLKISLLNIDIDFPETTQCVLDNFYDKVVKGGIIMFDNYLGKGINLGKGTGNIAYQGETKVINKFLKKKGKKIKFSPFFIRPSFIIK